MHFTGDVYHFLQRWRNEARKPNKIRSFPFRCFENFLARNHDPKIDNFEVITLQHDTHNIFANVVNITLYRRHDYLAIRFNDPALLFFDEGQQVCNGLFHHTRRFDHLRQEHLPVAKEIADHIHASHQWPFDDMQRSLGGKACLFRIFNNELINSFDQGVFKALLNRLLAPAQVCQVSLDTGRLPFVILSDIQESFCPVGPPVQYDVFNRIAKFFRQFFVDSKLAGINNAHVHPGLDGVIQKHRVNCFADNIIATKREGHIAYTTANEHTRQRFFNLPCCFDEITSIIIVFFDAGGHRKNIRIENNIGGIEVQFLRQYLVGTFANFYFSLDVVRLALFVERHDDDGSTVVANQSCLFNKGLFSFLEADRVDDRFSLHALKPSFYYGPFRGINHDRNPRDIGLGRDHVQVGNHRLFGIEHSLVHVDVDDLRTGINLLASYCNGLGVVIGLNQASEYRGARYVTALTDVDE